MHARNSLRGSMKTSVANFAKSYGKLAVLLGVMGIMAEAAAVNKGNVSLAEKRDPLLTPECRNARPRILTLSAKRYAMVTLSR